MTDRTDAGTPDRKGTRRTAPRTTMCMYCQAVGVPMEWDETQGQFVTETHPDEAHGIDPCHGSGKP